MRVSPSPPLSPPLPSLPFLLPFPPPPSPPPPLPRRPPLPAPASTDGCSVPCVSAAPDAAGEGGDAGPRTDASAKQTLPPFAGPAFLHAQRWETETGVLSWSKGSDRARLWGRAERMNCGARSSEKNSYLWSRITRWWKEGRNTLSQAILADE